MLYYFAALLATAAVVWFVQPRHAANRWAGLFLTSAAIGGTTDWLSDSGWVLAAGAIQYLNLTLTPYTVLVFALVYCERLRTPAQRTAGKLIPLLPVVGMAGWTTIAPEFQMNYTLLAVWAGAYYAAASYLLIHTWMRETDRHVRRSRGITALIMIPTLLAVFGLIYVGLAIDPEFAFFSYVSIFVTYSLGIALVFSFVYSVLGVRVRVESDPLEPALQAASSGASMLNHTIKNELGKIAISTANLRRELKEHEAAEDHLRIIAASSEHMLAMVSRIHGQMKELALRLEPCSPAHILDEVMLAYRERLAAADIRVSQTVDAQVHVLADPVHLREACGNIVANSIEAMPDGGELRIAVEIGRRQVRIRFSDTGIGLAPAQAARVFEPFYSTKGSNDNYGLGLSYVYRVMAKSGGSVQLASEPGAGTTVTLSFPRTRTREEDAS